MKKALAFIAILFSLSAAAQNYNDSAVTVDLPQKAAWWIGKHIKNSFSWDNRLAPTALKNYVGSGNNADSLFTVTLPASYITGMIELLFATASAVSSPDRLSIIDNSPAIPGYTSLATQIVNKANGATSEKNVAIFIRDYYLLRLADFTALYNEEKAGVINWANN